MLKNMITNAVSDGRVNVILRAYTVSSFQAVL